jgi:hypothetical protein
MSNDNFAKLVSSLPIASSHLMIFLFHPVLWYDNVIRVLPGLATSLMECPILAEASGVSHNLCRRNGFEPEDMALNRAVMLQWNFAWSFSRLWLKWVHREHVLSIANKHIDVFLKGAVRKQAMYDSDGYNDLLIGTQHLRFYLSMCQSEKMKEPTSKGSK